MEVLKIEINIALHYHCKIDDYQYQYCTIDDNTYIYAPKSKMWLLLLYGLDNTDNNRTTVK